VSQSNIRSSCCRVPLSTFSFPFVTPGSIGGRDIQSAGRDLHPSPGGTSACSPPGGDSNSKSGIVNVRTDMLRVSPVIFLQFTYLRGFADLLACSLIHLGSQLPILAPSYMGPHTGNEYLKIIKTLSGQLPA